MGISWINRKRILHNWKGWNLMIGWIATAVLILLIIEVFNERR